MSEFQISNGCLPRESLLERINSVLSTVIEQTPNFEERVKELHATLNRDPRATIDYQRYAYSFIYLYYAMNYSKACEVAEKISVPVNEPIEIIDLGTGSGAGIAGFIDGLYERNPRIPTITVWGIDASTLQIKLFNEVTRPYLTNKYGERLKIEISNGRIENLTPEDIKQAEYVLDSHALTELSKEHLETFIRTISATNGDGPTLIAIEQRRSGVLSEIQELWQNEGHVEPDFGRVELPELSELKKLELSTSYCRSSELSYGVFRPPVAYDRIYSIREPDKRLVYK